MIDLLRSPHMQNIHLTLQNRLQRLAQVSERGEKLLENLERRVETEKKNLEISYENNLKKLEQYLRMKRILIEASLSEISADQFRTESVLAALEVVTPLEAQEISMRPIPNCEISVDDVPQFASARELKLLESLAVKTQEISDLHKKPTPKTTSFPRAMFPVSPVSRVEFYTKLERAGHCASEIHEWMLSGADENGDVWINRIC